MLEDLQATNWMIIDAVRYCIGRRSYQVSTTTDWLIANWEKIHPRTREIIKRDIDDAFREQEVIQGRLGDRIDMCSWQAVKDLYEKEKT